MAYLVNVTVRAERDLAQLFEDIHAADSESARRWYRGLKKTILSLERFPNRSPVFRGRGNLRALLYGRKPNVYRVIYRVLEKQREVQVLHIRHGARREVKDSGLGGKSAR